MKKGIILLAFGIIFTISGFTFLGQKSQQVLTSLGLSNSEALARAEGDDWRSGYQTGTIVVNGRTIPCCVGSSSTNACNYGAVSCIRIF